MSELILRSYIISNAYMKKHNLYCKKRYIFYDYINKYISSAGVPNGYELNDFLQYNKHKFTRKINKKEV